MKKSDKFILLLLCFVGLLIAATFGYRFLTEYYAPSEFKTITDDTSDTKEDTTEASDTTTMVPDFTVYDPDGNAFTLYDNLGKPIVLNFWATWCGPCQSEMPAFDKMYQAYKDRVTFLMVNVTDGSRDTPESVTAFYEASGYSFPIYLDTSLEASMTYGAYSIPVTFFIDAKGNLLYNHRGAISEDALSECMELLIQSDTGSD